MSAQFYIIGTIAASAITLGSTGSPLMAIGTLGLGAMATKEQIEAEHRSYRTQLGVAPEPPRITATAATETAQQVSINIENNPQIEFSPQISVNSPAPVFQPQSPARTAEPLAAPQRSGPSPWEQSGELPVEDIAPLIASQNHSLIAAITDSGKTTTLCGAIRHRYEAMGGHCEFWIADPKGSSYMGLNRSKTYLRVRPETVDRLPAFLDAVYAELNRRIDARESTGQPTTAPLLTVVLDEWPSMLTELNFTNPKLAKHAAKRVNQLIFMGREDRISVWLVSQSHYVQQIGLDGSVRDNMAIFAQGRKDRLETLAKIAEDQNVIPNRDVRQLLSNQVKDATGTEIPLCLTQIGGPPRVFQVADLRDYIDWQYPLGDDEPEEIEVEVEPEIEAAEAPSQPLEITAQQRGEILRLFRAGETSEAAIVGSAFGVGRGDSGYGEAVEALKTVLGQTGDLAEWEQRQAPRKGGIPRRA